MIVTGCPRDSSMYPRTERCDVKEARICSISGDGASAEVDAAVVLASVGENIELSVGDLTDISRGSVTSKAEEVRKASGRSLSWALGG